MFLVRCIQILICFNKYKSENKGVCGPLSYSYCQNEDERGKKGRTQEGFTVMTDSHTKGLVHLVNSESPQGAATDSSNLLTHFLKIQINQFCGKKKN